MSRYKTGREMLDEARKAASSFSSSGVSFLTLKDGESVILRFLNGIDTMAIYNHSCGVQNAEISEADVTASLEAHGFVACVNCGEPLNLEEGGDIVGVRPSILAAPVHSAPSPSDGRRRPFVCLTGTEYECPICAVMKADKPSEQAFPARDRYYGLAVVRKAKMEKKVRQGIPTMVVKDIEDSYVTDEETGEQRLEVVLISQAFSNFWGTLDNVAKAQGSIAYFDFQVTRYGKEFDTKYVFEKMQDEPSPIPFSQYADAMFDIGEFLDNTIGSPKYYQKFGWHVPGYVAPNDDEGDADAAVSQQASLPSTAPTVSQTVASDGSAAESTAAPDGGLSGTRFSLVQDLMSKYAK